MDLVFLHGGAAAGKLTIARVLGERLRYGVFHNHLVVDALTAVFPFASPPFVELRERFWLDTFAQAAASGTSLVFTFAPEPSVAVGFPSRARAAVERSGGRVAFVELVVSAAEQERRLDLPSRHEFGKLTDVATLHRLRASTPALERPPADLRIDTGAGEPADSATRIIDHFDLRPAPAWERYP